VTSFDPGDLEDAGMTDEEIDDELYWKEVWTDGPPADRVPSAPITGDEGLTWPQRIAHYARTTGYPAALFPCESGQVVGVWVMGNRYTVASTYYGGYPHGYLSRVKALFPDKRRVLHLFSGHVDTTILPGDTCDINADLQPTFVDDAQTLRQVPLEQYDLVLSDPPYSVEDADHYQTTMIKRNVVMRTLGQRLSSGCHVCWLDQVLPMYRKADFAVEAYVAVVKSTNHRFRVLTIFRKR
jgi:hypothetical protein